MADDPREVRRLAIRKMLEQACVQDNLNALSNELLAAHDRVDPLRALLADEDEAVALILGAVAKSDSGTLSARQLGDISRAVLAALREVVGL